MSRPANTSGAACPYTTEALNKAVRYRADDRWIAQYLDVKVDLVRRARNRLPMDHPKSSRSLRRAAFLKP